MGTSQRWCKELAVKTLLWTSAGCHSQRFRRRPGKGGPHEVTGFCLLDFSLFLFARWEKLMGFR